MKAGDHVTWMHVPRGGYGYTMPVDAEIVKLHGKYATVKVKKRSGEMVRRRVALTALREKPSRARGTICKYCDRPLVGIVEVRRGSGVYDRLCPVRDGDVCERAIS